MKGYRTIIVNMLLTLAMGGTVQFSNLPPAAQHWLTIATLAWGFIAILLRLVTDTPVGKKLEADVERELGLSPAQMDALIARLPAKADVADLMAQGQKVIAAVEAMKGAPAPSSQQNGPASA